MNRPRLTPPAGLLLLTTLLLLAVSPAGATDRPYRVHWANNDLNVNPLAEVAVDNVPFDMNGHGHAMTGHGHARARYGSTAVAFLTRDHAYGWAIRYRVGNPTRQVGVDMLDVARWTGQNRWGGRVKNYGCYFVNWSGSSWRGTYILRGVR